jgi:dolichyl-phosphate-mannose--protein O-mannosyl transferase
MVVINIGRRVTFFYYWDSNAFALVSIAIILDFGFEMFYHTQE